MTLERTATPEGPVVVNPLQPVREQMPPDWTPHCAWEWEFGVTVSFGLN
jgi:hypothetical protein